MTPHPIGFSLAFLGAFSVATSVSMALFVGMLRSGLETPGSLPWTCLAIVSAVVLGPALAPSARLRAWEPTLWPAACISLALLAAVPLALFLPGMSIVYGAIALAGAVRSVPRLRGIRPAELAFLILGPPLVAAYLFLQLHGTVFVGSRFFAVALAPELALVSMLAPDTLFHAAISHMIMNFGVASTGLDGLVPITYHVGSHAWFAGLASAASSTPLPAYAHGQLIVALPLLLFSACFAALASGSWRASTLATFLGVLAVAVWADFTGWNHHYTSESQTLGLIVVLLAFPAVLDLLRAPGQSTTRAGGVRTIFLLLSILAAVWVKFSAGAVLGAAVAWGGLRAFGGGLRLVVLGIGLAALAIFAQTQVAHHTPSFSFLHFYRDSSLQGLDRLAGYTTPLVPLLAIGLMTLRRIADLGVRESRLRMEVLGVVTAASLAPGFFLKIASPNPWWFGNVAQWLGISALGSWIASRGTSAGRWGRAPAALLAMVSLALAIRVGLGAADRFEEANGELFRHAGILEGPAVRADRWPSLRAAASHALGGETLFGPSQLEWLEQSPTSRVVRAVEAQLGGAERDGVAIFAPPSNRDVWTSRVISCRSPSLRVPALTGLPLLRGLHPHCPLLIDKAGYGFADYEKSAHASPSTPAELCERARARDLREVLILESTRNLHRNRLLSCEP